jgi:hypothetical protein
MTYEEVEERVSKLEAVLGDLLSRPTWANSLGYSCKRYRGSQSANHRSAVLRMHRYRFLWTTHQTEATLKYLTKNKIYAMSSKGDTMDLLNFKVIQKKK